MFKLVFVIGNFVKKKDRIKEVITSWSSVLFLLASGLKCARALGHDASVQLYRQVLQMIGLVRQNFLVVWFVRHQPRTRRDPGSSRPRKKQKRGHALDQTHEQDLAGGGLLVF